MLQLQIKQYTTIEQPESGALKLGFDLKAGIAYYVLDDVVIVAVQDDLVIYWEDRDYYSYDLTTQVKTHLVEDKAYDSGITQWSSSGVYSNDDMCVIQMIDGGANKDTYYMFVYDWARGDFFELTNID